MFGDVTSFTDPTGQVTQYHYDRLNRLVEIIEPGGGSTARSYDLDNNLLTQTDENGRVTQYTYDVQNRAVGITDSTGRTIQYGYDAVGNVTSTTDGRGATTSMAYDALNRLTSVTDPAGTVISADLDPYGNPLTVHDARGFIYSQSYDDRDLLTSLSDPLGDTTRFSYSSVAQVDSRTNALGETTRYEYDRRERPMRVDYSDGTEIDFGFDPGGRMTRATSAQSDFSYTYDADDELTAVSNGLTGETIRYDYDDRGQRSTMTDPDGVVTRYTYDERALLTTINRGGRDEAQFTYDPAGQLTQRVDGSGIITEYHYTGADHLDLIQARKSDGSTLFRQGFERDGNYNVTRMEQELTLPDASHQTNILHYIYDDLDRLVHEERRAADDTTILSRRDYDYDPSGNRTRRVQDGVTTAYEYNSANQLLSETTGSRVITYTYDADGNLLTEQTMDGQPLSYSYDHENRLIGISGPGVNASYILAPDGKRLAKTVNGVMTTYVYDGLNVITESRSDQTTKYLFGRDADENLLKEANGDRFYYHRGNVNSVLGLTNASQDVVNTYDYAAFGEPLLATEGTYNPYRFTGRQLESESEHYYFRERLYSSRSGRFLAVEPSRADAVRSLEFGRTPRSLEFGRTPRSLEFGRTPRPLEFGRTPRPLEFGRTPRSLEFGRTPRQLSNELLYQAPRPIGLDRQDLEPYVYAGNSPTKRRDPTGEMPTSNGSMIGASGTPKFRW